MSNVLLLRAPTNDGSDKYEVALRAQGYYPVCVPVLETVLVNGNELSETIRKGPHALNIGGVIVTSARACEGWREAILLPSHSSSHDAGACIMPAMCGIDQFWQRRLVSNSILRSGGDNGNGTAKHT